jgi:hypothetical protein
MTQQQRLTSCSCRVPFAFDAPFLEPFNIFDPHTSETRQTTFTLNSTTGGALEATSTTAILQNHVGDGLFPFDAQAGQMAVDSPSGSAAMKTPPPLKPDLSPPPLAKGTDGTAPLGFLPFSADGNSNISGITPTDPTGSMIGLDQPRLPSLREVQEWTWNTSSGLDRETGTVSDHPEEAAERLLQEFIELNCTTESAQYDIMGMADTVGLYSSYFRRSTLDGRQNTEGLMRFLEILEHRMREISEIASQKVLEQVHKSRQALKSYEAYHDPIKRVQDGQRRCARDRAEFFRARYDLTKPLSQQV